MSFLQRTPFFRLLFPLIVGIFCFQFLDLSSAVFYVLTSLAIISVISSFFVHKLSKQYQFRWVFGFAAFLALFLVGFFIAQQKNQQANFQHLDEKGIFSVEIIESPIEKEKSYLCRVKIIEFYDSLLIRYPSSGKAILYVEKDSSSALLESGDRIIISTVFKKPDAVVNPNGFNYAAYLKRQEIGSTTYISAENWRKVGENTAFSLFKLADKYQKSLMNIYGSFGIEGDEFAILAALTLGSKDALHPELRQNFTTSGGMHILAVSGLHVGIIFMVLSFLFRFLDRSPRLKYLKAFFVVTLLWAYAFITGLPPSVIRSTLMFSLIAIGACLERKSQIYNTVAFSAFLMLLIDPDFLYDVGFQLSFSAVISIVYFQPTISKWFYIKNKVLRWLWELVAVSLAAQIGTAPFAIFYFHQFPNYFILTNILAIPLAIVIIYLAVMLFVVSSMPLVSTAVAFVLNFSLIALNRGIEWIHNLPYSLSVLSINSWQLFCVFAAIIFASVYFHKRKFFPLFFSCSFVLIFFCIDAFMNYKSIHSSAMVVYSDNKNLHVDFVNGKNHSVYSTDYSSIERVASNYWLASKLNDPILLENSSYYKDGFLRFQNKTILILSTDMLDDKTNEMPFVVDFLIIGNSLKPRINELLSCLNPKTIIVDKTISDWYTESIRRQCVEEGIHFYSIAENGAFTLNFKH